MEQTGVRSTHMTILSIKGHYEMGYYQTFKKLQVNKDHLSRLEYLDWVETLKDFYKPLEWVLSRRDN
jgi:hypothetical protein